MAVLRLIDALPDFGAAPKPASDPTPAAPARQGHGRPREIDVAETVRFEVARAEEALIARLAAEHESALITQRDRHAAELEVLSRDLGQDAAARIAEAVDTMERRVEAHVRTVVARIVGGLLSDELQRRSIDSLVRSIRDAIADAEAVRIEVRGPLSLYTALETALGSRLDTLHFTEADGFDLTVSIDGTVFETRLSEWSSVLSEVLA